MNSTSYISVFVFLFVITINAQVEVMALNKDWQMSQMNSGEWYASDVPGSVQMDLLQHNLIPHPFIGTNEDSIQWIEDEQWVFKTSFTANPDQQKHHSLRFQGIDTYAEVYFNNQLILTCDNMFRQWDVNVAALIKEENELKLVFTAPKKIHENNPHVLSNRLPNDGVPERPLSRKAAYHFGWDWGPRIVTMGIWRPIEYIYYNNNGIASVTLETSRYEEFEATIQGSIILKEPLEKKLKYKLFLDDELVDKGSIQEQQHDIKFRMYNPDLWWPTNKGDANLYQVRLELYSNDQRIDQYDDRFGVRTVKLIQEPDTIGTSFYFLINSEPVFCKGANYIPLSHFNGSHKKEQYHQILQAAVDANMNMVRVWGGGVYENDVFYELCDSMGLMVWQDFMFANTMIVPEMNKSIEKEIADNVLRLANHPSIIHWCGNNEMNVAWHNWGWQEQYNMSDLWQKELYENYELLFQELIPNTLRTALPNATYSHSSPLSNWGTAENFNHGSMHYWGVFHGTDSFADYPKNVGRFNSEYGFQTLPLWSTLQYLFNGEALTIDEDLLTHRQKSYRGNAPIFNALQQNYLPTSNLQELSYLTQLNQANGISYAIQHHRSNRPHCMGSLYWQLNDVWPAISWSGLEYNGQWRALHYKVRESFKDYTFFVDTLTTPPKMVVINDGQREKTSMIQVVLFDQKGKVSNEDVYHIVTQPNEVKKFQFQLPKTHQPETNLAACYLSVTMECEGDIQHKLLNLQPWKKYDLTPSDIHVQYEVKENQTRIKLTSFFALIGVQLSSKEEGYFDDNYFNLRPNETKIITFTSDAVIQDIQDNFSIYSLNDFQQ